MAGEPGALFQNMGANIQLTGTQQLQTDVAAVNTSLGKVKDKLHITRDAFLFTAFGLLAAGGMVKRFGDSVKKVMDDMVNSFEAVDYQATITGTVMNVYGDGIDTIREHMLQLGRDTEWTATQSGDAMQRLAMAGFNMNETLGAANATLQLATIGLTDTTTAAALAVGAYRGFSYEAESTGEVAQNMSTIVSNLSYAITHSATMMEELGDALKFVAAAADMVDWELEEVTAGLMIAADNMVQAGIAGRAMRMSIINLARAAGIATGESQNLKNALEELGIVLTDDEGSLKKLHEIVYDLTLSMASFGDAQRLSTMRMMFSARATTTWASYLKEGYKYLRQLREENENYIYTEEDYAKAAEINAAAIQHRTFAMKAAAVKEQIAIFYGRENVKILKQWRRQVQEMGKPIGNLIEELEAMGFEGEVVADIVDILTSDFKGMEDAINDAGMTSEITRERLSTLHGTMLLLTSSVDALWASIGQELADVMIEWNRLLRSIADALSKLPWWLKMTIGLLILLGATIIPLIGKTMMFLGTISMLMAALTVLTGKTMAQMTANEMLAASKVMLAQASTLLKAALWRMTVAFGKLMLSMGLIIMYFMIVEHVWRRVGPLAGAITASVLGMALAMWLLRKRVWSNIRAMWANTGSLLVYTKTVALATGGTVTWTMALTKLNMVMIASPLFLIVGSLALIAAGFWEIGLVIGWLAVVWAILNVVMYASPITYIVMAFAMLVMAILTLLGLSGELEKWFAGKHSFNTVVEHSTKGSAEMQSGFEGVTESVGGVMSAGRAAETFKARKGMAAGPASTTNSNSKSIMINNPRVENKFGRIDTRAYMSPRELERMVETSSSRALENWKTSFEAEGGI